MKYLEVAFATTIIFTTVFGIGCLVAWGIINASP